MFDYYINDLQFKFNYKSNNYVRDFAKPLLQSFTELISNRKVYCGLSFINHFRENNDFWAWIFDQDDEIFRSNFLVFLSNLIDIDISQVNHGEPSDSYLFNDYVFSGQSFSTPEILYENNYALITPSTVWTSEITDTVIKNKTPKKIYNLRHSVNIFLYETLYNESAIQSYFQRLGFDLTPDFELADWARISEDDKIEILSNFLTDHTNLISCRFEKLGKMGKSNKVMPVICIGKSLYEYRLATQNFRFYFQVINSKLIFLLGIVKKSASIDTRIKNKLESKMIKIR